MHLTAGLRNDIKASIREARWADGHKRRVYRWLGAMPDGLVRTCPTCSSGYDAPEGHECAETLVRQLNLEDAADEHYYRTLLVNGEELDTEWTAYLANRGPHWVNRLSDEFKLNVCFGSEYVFIAAAPLLRGARYGLTAPNSHISILHAGLFTTGLDVADMCLVHHLLHGVNPRYEPEHGPAFRKFLNKVYPWSKPGPVTEYDPGTPRRELWQRVVEALP